jgi:hypothetical protein
VGISFTEWLVDATFVYIQFNNIVLNPTAIPHQQVWPWLHPRISAVSNKVILCSKVSTDDLPSACQESGRVALEPFQQFLPDWPRYA